MQLEFVCVFLILGHKRAFVLSWARICGLPLVRTRGKASLCFLLSSYLWLVSCTYPWQFFSFSCVFSPLALCAEILRRDSGQAAKNHTLCDCYVPQYTTHRERLFTKQHCTAQQHSAAILRLTAVLYSHIPGRNYHTRYMLLTITSVMQLHLPLRYVPRGGARQVTENEPSIRLKKQTYASIRLRRTGTYNTHVYLVPFECCCEQLFGVLSAKTQFWQHR